MSVAAPNSAANQTAGSFQSDRIRFLDGLRGIAITSVVFCHSYFAIPKILGRPDGGIYDYAEYFGFGVELFFLISGFVILLTLDKTAHFLDFMFRRWVRLFPAMLICTVFILATGLLLPERPLGTPSLRDALPGLTFLQQDWWEAVLGGKQGVLELAYWTLFLEMKFYAVFGILYYLFGRLRAIYGLITLFLLANALIILNYIATRHAPGLDLKVFAMLRSLALGIGSDYFGWFGAGALYYLYHQTQKRKWLFAAIVVNILAIILLKGTHFGFKGASLLFSIIFFLSMTSPFVKKLLSNRSLIFMGFISYPLYLNHENLIVALSTKLLHALPMLPLALAPVLPIVFAGFIAWLVAAFAEQPVRKGIRALISSLPALMKVSYKAVTS